MIVTGETSTRFYQLYNTPRNIHKPTWLPEKRTLLSTELQEDGQGKLHYVETLRCLSADAMTLTTLTRKCPLGGEGGFAYGQQQRHASSPGVFPALQGEGVELWEMEGDTPKRVLYKHSNNTQEEVIWSATPTEEQLKLAPYTERAHPEAQPDWYHTCDLIRTADGKRAIRITENSTGCLHYLIDVFTLEDGKWVEEPYSAQLSTRWGSLDVQLTNDGVTGIFLDNDLELRIPIHIPFNEMPKHITYRTDSAGYATPLVDAAASGNTEIVRALLRCPRVDPGAVNYEGKDAAMVAANEEIYHLVHQAQAGNYDRAAALKSARLYWQAAVDGKVDPHIIHGSPEIYLQNIIRAQEEHRELTDKFHKLEESGYAPPCLNWNADRAEKLFRRHFYYDIIGDQVYWDAEENAQYTTRLDVAEEGCVTYSEIIRIYSPDKTRITTITRHNDEAGRFVYEVKTEPAASASFAEEAPWKPFVWEGSGVQDESMRSRILTSPDGKHKLLRIAPGNRHEKLCLLHLTPDADGVWHEGEPMINIVAVEGQPNVHLTNEGIYAIFRDSARERYHIRFFPYTALPSESIIYPAN